MWRGRAVAVRTLPAEVARDPAQMVGLAAQIAALSQLRQEKSDRGDDNPDQEALIRCCNSWPCRHSRAFFWNGALLSAFIWMLKITFETILADSLSKCSIFSVTRLVLCVTFLFIFFALVARTALRVWESYRDGVGYLETSGRAKRRKAAYTEDRVYSSFESVAIK